VTVTTALTVPVQWDDVTPEWMTRALARRCPDARVESVELLLVDDGTNRRARFGVTYGSGTGPARVFVKAESDVPGRREVHARNGNLFNEPRLFAADIELPLEHARAFAAVVDEANLDYVVVFEDVLDRGADPRDSTRPLSVDQVANGLAGLARLHHRYWDRVAAEPALAWVQPFLPTEGWLRPLRKILPFSLEQAAGTVAGIERVEVDPLVAVWADAIASLTSGPQTLLHGDPHIGNTYLLPDGTVGFLDWQVVRGGSWAQDVGYFIQGALTEADRRTHEHALVEQYVDDLDVANRPSAQEAWLRYRAAAAHGLAIWLITLPSDVHVKERSRTLVERYLAAYTELDTPDAVAHLAAATT
jgi:hypothetical protein